MYLLYNSTFILRLFYALLWITLAELAKLDELKGLIPTNTCSINKAPNRTINIYILFEINPSEGFNLRRDVYLRFAVFINYLKRSTRYKNVKLVLPPFPRLHHWKSTHIEQENIPWSSFFDMKSLQNYAAVIDFNNFVEEMNVTERKIVIDIFKLKQFEDTITNGRFRDKFSIKQCTKNDKFQYPLLRQPSLKIRNFICLLFQGSVNFLKEVLNQSIDNDKWSKNKSFGFMNAEIVLHDQWGNREYWIGRKSMKFNKHLIKIASEFRRKNLNSTVGGGGGDYLCIHLRRGDFIHGRDKTTPTLESTAEQIKKKLHELNLKTVFISSDCTNSEFENLKNYLQEFKLYRFSIKNLKFKSILDGSIAIIDQIICSHSRYFIGTFGSTFTYRIYEEREIMGFPTNTTYNTLCKNSNLENCMKNAVWPIVY